MITLEFKTRKFVKLLQSGDTLVLKIVSVTERGRGRWRFVVDDLTPESEAEVLYTCYFCGICEAPAEDGSIPKGWLFRKTEKGRQLFCSDHLCQRSRMCRVCGCNDDHACEGPLGEPCHWVEPDLCSSCVQKTESLGPKLKRPRK